MDHTEAQSKAIHARKKDYYDPDTKRFKYQKDTKTPKEKRVMANIQAMLTRHSSHLTASEAQNSLDSYFKSRKK